MQLALPSHEVGSCPDDTDGTTELFEITWNVSRAPGGPTQYWQAWQPVLLTPVFQVLPSACCLTGHREPGGG